MNGSSFSLMTGLISILLKFDSKHEQQETDTHVHFSYKNQLAYNRFKRQ